MGLATSEQWTEFHEYYRENVLKHLKFYRDFGVYALLDLLSRLPVPDYDNVAKEKGCNLLGVDRSFIRAVERQIEAVNDIARTYERMKTKPEFLYTSSGAASAPAFEYTGDGVNVSEATKRNIEGHFSDALKLLNTVID